MAYKIKSPLASIGSTNNTKSELKVTQNRDGSYTKSKGSASSTYNKTNSTTGKDGWTHNTYTNEHGNTEKSSTRDVSPAKGFMDVLGKVANPLSMLPGKAGEVAGKLNPLTAFKQTDDVANIDSESTDVAPSTTTTNTNTDTSTDTEPSTEPEDGEKESGEKTEEEPKETYLKRTSDAVKEWRGNRAEKKAVKKTKETKVKGEKKGIGTIVGNTAGKVHNAVDKASNWVKKEANELKNDHNADGTVVSRIAGNAKKGYKKTRASASPLPQKTKLYTDMPKEDREAAKEWNRKKYGTLSPTSKAKKKGVTKQQLAKEHKASTTVTKMPKLKATKVITEPRVSTKSKAGAAHRTKVLETAAAAKPRVPVTTANVKKTKTEKLTTKKIALANKQTERDANGKKGIFKNINSYINKKKVEKIDKKIARSKSKGK